MMHQVASRKGDIGLILPYPSDSSLRIYKSNRGGTLKTEHPIRACPTCLTYHYHSAVYELPWLLECPIHKCSLENQCPECRQPWPTCREFPKRDCPLCGRGLLTNWLASSNSSLKRLDTTNIERLWKLIKCIPEGHSLGNLRPEHFLREKKSDCNIFSMQYPKYLTSYLKEKGLHDDLNFLKNIKTVKSKIYSKEDLLTEISVDNKIDTTPLHDSVLLKTRFRAFQKIMKRVNDIAPNPHQLILCHPDFYLNKRAPKKVCPFCFALNVWIEHTQTYPYYPGVKLNRENYYCFEYLEEYFFYTPLALTHGFIFGEKRFLTSERFICWAYERDLLFLFAQLLTVAQTLNENPDRWRMGSRLSDHVIQQRVRTMDRLYSNHYIHIQDNKLFFYYSIKNPLDLIEIEPNDNHFRICEKWQKVMRKEKYFSTCAKANALATLKDYEDHENCLQKSYAPEKLAEFVPNDRIRWFKSYNLYFQEHQAEFSQIEISF